MTGHSVSPAAAVGPEQTAAGAPAAQRRPSEINSTLTLLQANLLVAGLAGFWARKADGHPGPDLMGRGLLMLNGLVNWERIKKKRARTKAPAKQARRKPGRSRLTKLQPRPKSPFNTLPE
jgi:hypothetical protein